MDQSRRQFLNATALTLASLTVGGNTLLAREASRSTSSPRTKGLLFNESDLARIRETITHPRFAPFWNSMSSADLEADTKFLEKELRLNNHVQDMLRARQILERTSFLYAITKDQQQLQVAKLAIDRIHQYKRWDFFLEGGTESIGFQRAPEATIAMSLARDWLDDGLSSETKLEMERQIAEKGAPACFRSLYGMKYPERVRGWGFDPEDDYKFRFDLSRWPLILNATNLKVIPIAGLGLAACLLHDKHPQAQRWLNMALQSARAFASMFGSDGSYDEGVSYWGYTAVHLALFVEVLHRTLGKDERSLINFSGTVRYGLQMSMPTIGKRDDCVNFGDASTLGDISIAAWVARTNKDPIAQHVATSVGEVKNHLALIWFDPSVQARQPGRELYDVRFDNDVVVSRTGWDEQDSVVGLRSGGPANHEHADRNSVVFKAYGERLLHDPLKAAYSYTLPHWVLRLTQAHTAVLINGKGHQYHDGHEGTNSSWAEAQIVEYKSSGQRLILTSDATDAYRLVDPDIELVRRTLVFLKPDVLFMYDRVRMKSAKAKAQVRYQVYNGDGKGKTEIKDGTFFINRPKASLKASIIASGPVKITSGNHVVPEDVGVYPYIEAEASEALDHRILTICTAQRAQQEHGTCIPTQNNSFWVVKIDHNTVKATVSLDVSSDLPVVTIV